MQQCTNFKDPGLQVYGGAVFKATRDEGDEVFIELPPPTPTGRSRGGYGMGGYGSATNAGAPSSAPIDMSRYYNAGGGCFKGSCAVAMADGTYKSVVDVCRGDSVATGDGSSLQTQSSVAVVNCVVKTQCPSGVAALVTLNNGAGPTLTPYHPVRVADAVGLPQWAFPKDLAPTVMQPADFVYTFLLERGGASMLIDGVECCTLGHGLDADVVRHAYLGSHGAVTADLEQMAGWDVGLVSLEPRDFIRENGVAGQICAIKQQHDARQVCRHSNVTRSTCAEVAPEAVIGTITTPAVAV